MTQASGYKFEVIGVLAASTMRNGPYLCMVARYYDSSCTDLQGDPELLRKPRSLSKLTLPIGLAWQVWTRILGAGIELGTSRYNQDTIATISYVHNLARALRRASFTGIVEKFRDL
jgi:hypothetical protein